MGERRIRSASGAEQRLKRPIYGPYSPLLGDAGPDPLTAKPTPDPRHDARVIPLPTSYRTRL